MKRKRRSVLAKNKARINLTVLIIMLILFSLGAFWWSSNLKPMTDSGQDQVFVLEAGMTASQIAQELKDKNIIRNAEVFRQLCKINKADSKLVAGLYYLSPAMSAQAILNILLQGPHPDVIRVTIPEGYSVAEIVNTLVKDGLGTQDEFYKVMQTYSAKDYDFLTGVPAGNNRLEGFLFPDTYFFDRKSKPKDVVDRFLGRFNKELTPETKARLEEMHVSVFTWVTKASMVEKEAAKEAERPLIAGVFENRLRTGMPLQSCATVQYVLGEVKPVLSLTDIEIDSPYNTYKNPGLPPGPIANPGHASLNAALYPARTDYFYFVAKNDGTHAFAVTYDEHLKNTKKYQ
ncbi:MAG: Endolytic murein transglycosylase [Candidatus Dichloromethanomonas elyunquensis]|nr:MAG: Endolytic murein transglycosylase [Candidatus Dichloromethanomonas elyunquensis]